MKLVIFDFDGTLADTETLITQTMMKTIEAMHLEPRSREEIRAMIGLPLKETFTRLIPMTDATGDACARLYQEIFARDNQPGVVQKLYDAGLTLTIATSRQRFSLMAFLRDMQIEHLFSYIVTVNDVEHAKPAPDMVVQTMERMGATPDETMMVGDAVYDIQMGVNAGVHTTAVTYGNGSREEMEACGAQHVIDDFADLYQVIV